MNPLQSAAQPLGLSHPLFRYVPNGEWLITSRSLASPAADGSVAYYLDVLSKHRIVDDDESDLAGDPAVMPFSDSLAAAACQWLSGLALARGLEVSDGPFVQVLDDDGAVPRGFVVLRAICWADEFDVLVPSTPGAADQYEQLTIEVPA